MEHENNDIIGTVKGMSQQELLKFAEIEVGLIQSRFDKFDQQFQGNRRLVITIVAAALAASTTLDRGVVLLAASTASVILLFLEAFQRETLFNGLVERHLLLRAALNDMAILKSIVIYDPFNDMAAEVPKRWKKEKADLFKYEMYVFYFIAATIPVAAFFFL